MKWTENFKVKFHETNANEALGVSQTFKYIQETAMCQLSVQKPTYKELLEQKKAFILSNIRVEMYSPIYAYENIEVRTWACESRGLNFIRCYDIKRGDEIVCEAYSSWALVSAEDKKLIKVSDIDLNEYFHDDAVTLERHSRVHIPSGLPMSLVDEYTVKYGDIDFNGHMNNTNYADILLNCIPNIENMRIKSIGISFITEAKYKENLKIYMSKTDGKYYFRTVRTSDGKINTEAEIISEAL